MLREISEPWWWTRRRPVKRWYSWTIWRRRLCWSCSVEICCKRMVLVFSFKAFCWLSHVVLKKIMKSVSEVSLYPDRSRKRVPFERNSEPSTASSSLIGPVHLLMVQWLGGGGGSQHIRSPKQTRLLRERKKTERKPSWWNAPSG
jgi:hypothetical protein